MAGKKSGLGRGLDAFFPEKTSQEKPKTVRNSRTKTNTVREKTTETEPTVKGETLVKISKVEPNREQPRKKFDEDALLELSESIKLYGVCSPCSYLTRKIIMKSLPVKEDGGQRRWQV